MIHQKNTILTTNVLLQAHLVYFAVFVQHRYYLYMYLSMESIRGKSHSNITRERLSNVEWNASGYNHLLRS